MAWVVEPDTPIGTKNGFDYAVFLSREDETGYFCLVLASSPTGQGEWLNQNRILYSGSEAELMAEISRAGGVRAWISSFIATIQAWLDDLTTVEPMPDSVKTAVDVRSWLEANTEWATVNGRLIFRLKA